MNMLDMPGHVCQTSADVLQSAEALSDNLSGRVQYMGNLCTLHIFIGFPIIEKILFRTITSTISYSNANLS